MSPSAVPRRCPVGFKNRPSVRAALLRLSLLRAGVLGQCPASAGRVCSTVRVTAPGHHDRGATKSRGTRAGTAGAARRDDSRQPSRRNSPEMSFSGKFTPRRAPPVRSTFYCGRSALDDESQHERLRTARNGRSFVLGRKSKHLAFTLGQVTQLHRTTCRRQSKTWRRGVQFSIAMRCGSSSPVTSTTRNRCPSGAGA